MTKEIWKDVPGTGGNYQVSSCGRVKRIAAGRGAQPGKILVPCYNNYGYQKVALGRKGGQKQVHALVAMSFIGPRPEGTQVNHKDGDKTNNIPSNLEYVTPLENTTHARMVLGVVNYGERNGLSKLTRDNVRSIRQLYSTGDYTQQQLADLFGVARGHVSLLVTGRSWKWLT